MWILAGQELFEMSPKLTDFQSSKSRSTSPTSGYDMRCLQSHLVSVSYTYLSMFCSCICSAYHVCDQLHANGYSQNIHQYLVSA